MIDENGTAGPPRGPGRPRRADQRDTREIVLACATELFAARGFDAVGMRDVARAAGVNVATVHHHTGRKVDLYDACFARIFDAETAALLTAFDPAVAALDEGGPALRRAMHDIADTFTDFLEEHPETTSLWLRRWLAPRELSNLSHAYAHPLYSRVEDLLARADAAGLLVEPTPHVAVRSLVWAVHGHVVELETAADAARARGDLRAYLHRWLDSMYPPVAD
ncbi:TetR/AcrR family transcriptional regulator [Paraoerskovia marina]|uniref:TetR/AcrR family transcriptional regulator n=1 Tax=Paraoerskovia marina TaxID=545619 RepID=UPI000492E4B1|nr:TetR/AcrR family transcriptional regulator [Paraoerskovia marina]